MAGLAACRAADFGDSLRADIRAIRTRAEPAIEAPHEFSGGGAIQEGAGSGIFHNEEKGG